MVELDAEGRGEGDPGRSKILAVLIVVVVVVSIIGVVSTFSMWDVDTSFSVEARVDRYHVRMGQNISFSAQVRNGAVNNVTWNFSDGSVSDEMAPNHSFRRPGIYLVSVVVYSKAGERAEDVVLVGSQRHNERYDGTRPGWTEYDPHTWGGPGASVILGPNSAQPTVNISIRMEHPNGTFWFRVGYYIYEPGDHEEYHIVYTLNVTLYGENETFRHTVEPTDLKSNVSTCSHSELYATMQMYDGSVDGFVFNLTTSFPMVRPHLWMSEGI